MALDDVFTVTYPNSQNSVDSTQAERLALIIEDYSGQVEGTVQRRSITTGFIPFKTVRGSATFTNHAVGESTLQKLVPGAALDGTKNDFAKNSVTIDTVLAARNTLPMLDVLQTQDDVLREISTEHGKKIAKMIDNAILIQAAKAAALAESSFSNGTSGKPAGHFGGSTETLADAADLADPAKLYQALLNLFVKMEVKDVDPANDDVVIIVTPAVHAVLAQAEMLVNANYITSMGNTLQGATVLKALGVPILKSNNLPQTNITSHLLSNAGNSNAYNGDFTKLGLLAFSPRAVMAGVTIPVTTDIFWDKVYKMWFVDAHLSFAAGPNRAEFAGRIMKP